MRQLIVLREGEVRTGHASAGETRVAEGGSTEVKISGDGSQPVGPQDLEFPAGTAVVAEGIFTSGKGHWLKLDVGRGPDIMLQDMRVADAKAESMHERAVEVRGLWTPARLSDQPAKEMDPGPGAAQPVPRMLPPSIKVESFKVLGGLPPKWRGSVRRAEENTSWGRAVQLPAAASFSVKCDRPGDQVTAEVAGDALTLTVTSPRGIGGASVTPEKNPWPKKVTVRLALKGLEGFSAECGGKKLSGRLGSPPEKNDGLVVEKQGEFIEVTLPEGFAADAQAVLKLSWVDFYR